jgi:hypothetical protein
VADVPEVRDPRRTPFPTAGTGLTRRHRADSLLRRTRAPHPAHRACRSDPRSSRARRGAATRRRLSDPPASKSMLVRAMNPVPADPSHTRATPSAGRDRPGVSAAVATGPRPPIAADPERRPTARHTRVTRATPAPAPVTAGIGTRSATVQASSGHRLRLFTERLISVGRGLGSVDLASISWS